MKRKFIIVSVIALVISAIVVWAQPNRECRDGMTRVTIVNPAGKVIEICVPDDVVDNIGGPNDIVIPASCPCFTPDSIDDNVRELTGISCRDDVGYYPNGETYMGDTHYKAWSIYSDQCEDLGDIFLCSCQLLDQEFGILSWAVDISYDEYEACRQILINSEMWALNCDGPQEEICDNKIDDDGDTYADCNDTDCVGDSNCLKACIDNSDCGTGDWCKIPVGACDGAGICEDRIALCVLEDVCGEDGITYDSICDAGKADVCVVHTGECLP